ncbi:glyoxylase-like metal-dependent hydrolase (beta-lactamase superfamily II) [Streptomyces sp. V4I23]|uniref:MBL fold metallo-hydrolase n=1 Tax=Streptomyces sp. V4I23 TaxID=3042282 RepID=UPI002788E1FA|nr:MBL fold metallo-hydrolase [Streptomyces sp. V4I23]MDQ1013018.1 glyoxylase-like metal-dependent hydrolase (beta-lactamase superfamily II) [Streptomyces sp. V4I23]
MTARIEHLVTSGTFQLDGGGWEVDNNVWLIGDDREVLVIDAAHDAAAIAAAVGDRRLVGIVCTHAHNDHINAAPALAARTKAPILLHPADAVLWKEVHPDREHGHWELVDGELLTVADTGLYVLHTPGHSPGAICLYVPELGVLFSGDTLFQGGPGATGRSYSDFDTIIASIRDRLLTLPADTTVHPGHGATTSIGAEAPHLDDWIARGH